MFFSHGSLELYGLCLLFLGGLELFSFLVDIQGIIGVACPRLFFMAIRTVAVLTFTILQYFENFLLFLNTFFLLLELVYICLEIPSLLWRVVVIFYTRLYKN